jgi:hypothetical protein
MVPITNVSFVSFVAVKYVLVMPKFECTLGLITLTCLRPLVPTLLLPTTVQTSIAESNTEPAYTYPIMLEDSLYLISICNCPCFFDHDCAEIAAIISNACSNAYSNAYYCAYQITNSWCNPVFRFSNTTCSYKCQYQFKKTCLLPFANFFLVHCSNLYDNPQCCICVEPCEHMPIVKNGLCDNLTRCSAKTLSVSHQVGNCFTVKSPEWRVKHQSP